MGSKEERNKHPVFAHAEDLAKLTTFVVAVLYVLGVLISNVQLMELGVSDFASLQTRNILTGFMFVIYIVLGLLILLPSALMLFAFGRAIRSDMPRAAKVRAIGRYLLRWSIASIGFAFLAAVVMGLLYPWGRPFIESNPSPPAGMAALQHMLGNMLSIWEQFRVSYFHIRILFTLAMLLPLILMVPLIDWLIGLLGRISKQDRALGMSPLLIRYTRPAVIVAVTLYLAFIVPAVLFDYAYEIYPNIRYNLGGGQPQIAELVLTGKPPDLAGVSGTRICCDEGSAANATKAQSTTGETEHAIRTMELAIWYQSDKYLYVADQPTTPSGKINIQVHAIDLKLVRSIRYLPKYARIVSAGRIVSVHSY